MRFVAAALPLFHPQDSRLKGLIAELEKSQLTLAELRALTPKERRALAESLGATRASTPSVIRAMQHCLACDDNTNVSLISAPFPRVTSNAWFPSHYPYPPVMRSYTSSAAVLIEALSADAVAAASAAENRAAANPSFVGTARDECGYVGLLNQGSTCYLNSLLQGLFHLVPFREAVYGMPTGDSAAPGGEGESSSAESNNNAHASTSLVIALQKLFYCMETQASPCSTTSLTASFGWTAAESFIQHDVHELTRILLDNIEEKIKAAKRVNFVSALFGGELRNFFKVPDVSYESGSNESFYDLGLVVKGCPDIYRSLDLFFETETMTGSNKYCVERDGTKSYHDAVRGVKLRSLPPVLLIHLNRFDFDPVSGQSSKVLSRWEYYDELDVAKYAPDIEPSSAQFELHSVLVHSGSDARFGHYYCFVKVKNGWLKFNDEMVEKASAYDVFGANFGGSAIGYWGTPTTLTTNAYMLVYRRKGDPSFTERALSIPAELVDRVQRDAKEAEQLRKERLEEHSYVRLSVVQEGHIRHQPTLLVNPNVRVDNAIVCRLPRERVEAAFKEHCTANLRVNGSRVCLWACEPTKTSWYRLGERVTTIDTTPEQFHSRRPAWYFMSEMSPEVSQLPVAETMLFHYKLFDIATAKLVYVGATVVGKSGLDVSVLKVTFASMLTAVVSRNELPTLPAGIEALPFEPFLEENDREIIDVPVVGNWYSGSIFVFECDSSRLAPPPAAETSTPPPSPSADAPPISTAEPSAPTVEATETKPVPAPLAISTPPPPQQSAARMKARTTKAFYHYLKHRTTLAFHWNDPHKNYPLAANLEVVDDATYEELQKIVAEALPGPMAPSPSPSPAASSSPSTGAAPTTPPTTTPVLWSHVRFLRYNPVLNGPTPQRPKKADIKRIRELIEYAGSLLDRVYFEVLPFPVETAESSKLIHFDWYNQHVKYVSSHVAVIPPTAQTLADVFSVCRAEVGLAPDVPVRILDVYRSKVYKAYEGPTHPAPVAFDEAYEFRMEPAPALIAGVAKEEQLFLNFYHASKSTTGNLGWNYHGEPFSMSVRKTARLAELTAAIAAKLEIPSVEAMKFWKFWLHSSKGTDIEMTDDFMSHVVRAAGQSGKAASGVVDSYVVVMEHAPPANSQKVVRREERALRIYN